MFQLHFIKSYDKSMLIKTPKVSRCNKCHHTLLHREISTKNFVTLTKNDANTPTRVTDG